MDAQKAEDKMILEVDAELKNNLESMLDGDYNILLKGLSPIAKPLANQKLTQRICKLLRKAKDLQTVVRGSKDVMRALRKNQSGIVFLGGDVYPVDLLTHIPVSCEEKKIPYCYVPSGILLSRSLHASGSCTCVMISENDSYKELYDKIKKKVSSMEIPLFC